MATTDWVRLQLPGWKHLGKYLLWGIGRVSFSLWLFSLNGLKASCKLCIQLVNMTERATYQLMAVYNQLPHMGTVGQQIIDSTAIPVPLVPDNIITDLLQSLGGKHALIVGDTGSGKSLLAQWLAYQVGGEVTVYDPDASPDEWKGLKVIGRRGDFESIQEAMTADLEELQRRIEVRGEHGDKALAGQDSVLIAEEFPLLKDEVPVSVDWLLKHARRGRKPKRFVIVLSQDDNVTTLGIEGQGAARKNFRMLRLGKLAVAHAKRLKETAILEWLQETNYRCMVDDLPCQLPDLSSYKMVIPRLLPEAVSQPAVTAETTAQSKLQPKNTETRVPDVAVSRAVKACLEAGLSDSKIIKEVLGYQGSQYQQGKELLQSLRQK